LISNSFALRGKAKILRLSLKMKKEETKETTEIEVKKLKQEIKELKKIINNHRHDGHGFVVK